MDAAQPARAHRGVGGAHHGFAPRLCALEPAINCSYNKLVKLAWDDAKRKANRKKHGLDFALARRFEWPSAVVLADLRRDYGEPRFVAVGFIGERVYVMAFTRRGEALRIISLRKANKREIRLYEEAQ